MPRIDRNYLESLLRDMHRGSSDAFAAVFLAKVDSMYQQAIRCTDNIYLVQDYIREVYIALWKQLPNIHSGRELHNIYQHLDRKAFRTLHRAAKQSPGGAAAPPLTSDIREHMITDILSSVGAPEMQKPIQDIIHYNNYRKLRARLIRAILIIVLSASAVSPLLFSKPHCSVKMATSGNTSSQIIQLSVKSMMPITSVTAMVNGELMPVSRKSRSRYTIQPTRNGKMTITVTTANGRTDTLTQNITDVDDEPPQVTASRYAYGILSLTLSDNSQTISKSAVSLSDDDGNIYNPTHYSAQTNCFDYKVPSHHTYILQAEDPNGNVLWTYVHVG